MLPIITPRGYSTQIMVKYLTDNKNQSNSSQKIVKRENSSLKEVDQFYFLRQVMTAPPPLILKIKGKNHTMHARETGSVTNAMFD